MYTKEQLIKYLENILNHYGKITTSIIDSDKTVPTRKAFVREFGSIQKACEAIGYYDYKKGKFTIEDAQADINKINSDIKLLEFNGMREKNLTKCLKCNYEWLVNTDSLVHKLHCNCPNCSFKDTKFSQQLQKLNMDYIGVIEGELKKVFCNNCNNFINASYSTIMRKNYKCPYCYPLNIRQWYINKHKTSKINDNFKQFMQEESPLFYYFLGWLMSDGHCSNNRLSIIIKEKDSYPLTQINKIIKINETTFMRDNFLYYKLEVMNIVVKDICDKYSIVSKKTYYPCDLSPIPLEKFPFFLAGFIDGDGHIGFYKNRIKIIIKLHNSWYDNLNYMINMIYNYFNVEKIPHALLTTNKNNNTYALINITNKKVIIPFYQLLLQYNIPVLTRKWDKIKEVIKI